MRIGVNITGTVLSAVAIEPHRDIRMVTVERTSDDLRSDLRMLLSQVIAAAHTEPAMLVFEMSSLLQTAETYPDVVIRISPRAPVDHDHELFSIFDPEALPRFVHIKGGSSTLGDDLVALDTEALERLSVTVEPGLRYVITAVGARMSPGHEQRAAEALLGLANPSRIEFSHSFASSSFAVRERTAVLNLGRVPSATTLALDLGLIGEELAPRARLYVTTNDGGRVPLTRLSLVPIHSTYSARSTELLGAAKLCGVTDGRLIIADENDGFLGVLAAGAPTIVPQHRDSSGRAVATPTANIVPVTSSSISRRGDSPVLLIKGNAETRIVHEVPRHVVADRHTQVDLRALGAACSPLVDWVNRIVRVGSANDIDHELSAARARVRARLVAFGALPAEVDIVESRVVATTYEHSDVVSVRVRGIAASPADLGTVQV